KTRWSLTRPRNARRNRRAYMATPIVVPGLGESVTEATVAKWMKNVGDPVKADEALAELETDKVTQELYAPAAGTLGEITAPAGTVGQMDEECRRSGEGRRSTGGAGDRQGHAGALCPRRRHAGRDHCSGRHRGRDRSRDRADHGWAGAPPYHPQKRT